MFFRVVVGSILSGLVMMVWGFVFWEVSPLGHQVLGGLPSDAGVFEALGKLNLESGMYFAPFPDAEVMKNPESEAAKQFMARHDAGPLFALVYRKEGAPGMGTVFGLGYLHCVVGSLLAGWLLAMAAPALPSYGRRVAFVTLLGVFAGVVVHFSHAIWFHFPWKGELFQTLHVVGCWFLAGLVLAAIVKAPAR